MRSRALRITQKHSKYTLACACELSGLPNTLQLYVLLHFCCIRIAENNVLICFSVFSALPYCRGQGGIVQTREGQLHPKRTSGVAFALSRVSFEVSFSSVAVAGTWQGPQEGPTMPMARSPTTSRKTATSKQYSTHYHNKTNGFLRNFPNNCTTPQSRYFIRHVAKWASRGSNIRIFH